jgi:predicted ATPase/DNA-binding SARP family transcriptional activator
VYKIAGAACKSGRVQIGILGPLEVRGDDGAALVVAGARLRSLLTCLALHAGRAVSVATLVDAVWGEAPPSDEQNALQTLVSRLRRTLGGAGLITQSPAGYRLEMPAHDVDAHRFQRLAADAAAALRAGDADTAARTFDAALALWRGPALADAGESGEADVARLADLRLSVQLDRVDALLALGRTAGLVAELEALLSDRPLDERLTGQLMRALASTGRQAEALAAYERLRARLADELGVDPSAELQTVHVSVLRGEVTAPGPAPVADEPAATRRTNLKAQLTSFVGREDEVSRIGKALEQNRLVTLVGPGGAGKTRLAAEAAATILDRATDGVWLVELAPLTDAGDLAQTVLGSLGIRETHLLARHTQLSARDALSRLRETLADRELVLILDNCEHLVEASARLADQLLAECPRLRVLTTSREPLGITGEVLLVVPPLGQPEPSAPPAEALEYPAVRLFADRAAAVVPDFVVDEATIPTVIQIVRRLDGLPLAIELAAARLRGMSLTEVSTRLSDRFRLLTGGSRTAMPRHRTLRAVVEWSWDLLAPAERALVERLAVFPAGATVASATAVCVDADVPADDVADLLASLVDKSLLQPVDGGGRVRMLETIREYGMERLAERSGGPPASEGVAGGGELAELRHKHADHFAAVLREAQPKLISAEQLPWFAMLRAERENILAAIRFRTDSGDADGALEVAVTLAGFAMLLGNHAEVPVLIGDALHAPGHKDQGLYWLGEALYTMNAVMGSVEGGTATTEAAMGRLHDVREHLDVLDVDSHPLVSLLRVAVAFFAGDAERSQRYVAEALESGSDWTAASVLMFRGSMAENSGDLDAMRTDITQALSEFRRIGERWGTASSLRALAQLHTVDGDLDTAEACYLEALDLMSELGSTDDEGFLRVRLADLRIRRGDMDGAREQLRRAREATDKTGSAVESVFTLCMTALVELEAGNREEADRLYAQTQARARTIPAHHPIHGHAMSLIMVMSASFALRSGELADARRWLAEAFPIALATTDMPIVASVGVTAAKVEAVDGDPARAARMLGASAVLRGADDPTSVDIRRLAGELTEVLGADGFSAAYAAGRSLSRDDAIALLDPA